MLSLFDTQILGVRTLHCNGTVAEVVDSDESHSVDHMHDFYWSASNRNPSSRFV